MHLLININALIVPLYGIFCQQSSKETWKCTKSLKNIIRWLQQRLHYKTLLSESGKCKVKVKLFWILFLEMFKSSKKTKFTLHGLITSRNKGSRIEQTNKQKKTWLKWTCNLYFYLTNDNKGKFSNWSALLGLIRKFVFWL